jgi:hypothetical protein
MNRTVFLNVVIAGGLVGIIGGVCGRDSSDARIADSTDAALADVISDRWIEDSSSACSGSRGDATANGDAAGPKAGVQVLTQRNDIARSGLNLQEKVLNTENVRHATFGKLFSREVDDELYAQLLIVSGLDIPGKGTRNVVFAATVNNTVYAFDADDPAETEPLWQKSFLPPGSRPTRASDMPGACGGNYRDFSGNIGIVSTPVIDDETKTTYFVTRTFEGGQHIQRLHAIDIVDGSERENSPVVITAQVPGTGDGSVLGTITFDSLRQNQRAGLLLLNGVAYLAWAGHCDWSPYHGWIIGYDTRTLQQSVVYNVTPDGAAGGIWQSSQGLASDGTHIYAVTGNGTVGEASDPRSTRNRGESFLKLIRSGSTLEVLSWFTPYNYAYLEQNDLDLGSAALLLIPGTHLGVSGGKGGRLYVVDVNDMGGLSISGVSDDNLIQSFDVNAPQHIHGTLLYWNGPEGGRVFIWGEEDYLRSYPFLGESYAVGSYVLDTEGVELSTMKAPTDEGAQILMPGGFLALSADGDAPGSAILWASLPFTGNANQDMQPGILRAFDAVDITQELWNNREDEERDICGNFAKFAVPTIANGKVYLGSFSNQFCVYGLLDEGR